MNPCARALHSDSMRLAPVKWTAHTPLINGLTQSEGWCSSLRADCKNHLLIEVTQMILKEHILAEIKRMASANGGAPLGRQRFADETGIREAAWSGKYWARWSDAIRDGGPIAQQVASRLHRRAFAGALRNAGSRVWSSTHRSRTEVACTANPKLSEPQHVRPLRYPRRTTRQPLQVCVYARRTRRRCRPSCAVRIGFCR